MKRLQSMNVAIAGSRARALGNAWDRTEAIERWGLLGSEVEGWKPR